MHTICVLFLLLLIKLHHSSGRECVIEGIPGVSGSDNSNIHTILVPSGETSIKLELTCKCSLYIPQWHTKSLEEEDGQFFIHPIYCINGTRPCSLNYIPESNKSQGLFVYLRKNFTITESTALMCFSNIDREALIVSFSNDYEGSSAIISSVLTSTVTETSTITTSSITTSTITRTSTTSVCSSKSKSIRVSSQDNTLSKSIVSTSSRANTISTTNSAAVTQTPNIGDTNGIIGSVGGPTSLGLIVMVLTLIIIIIGLCGIIICMKTRNKQREQVVHEIPSESNSSDTNRLSDIPLLWRNSNASQISELGTHMPRSFSTPIRSLSTNNNNNNNNNDDFRISMHYMTDTSSPVNQPVNGDDEIYPNPDAENV